MTSSFLIGGVYDQTGGVVTNSLDGKIKDLEKIEESAPKVIRDIGGNASSVHRGSFW
jgi:hypothetical protein